MKEIKRITTLLDSTAGHLHKRKQLIETLRRTAAAMEEGKGLDQSLFDGLMDDIELYNNENAALLRQAGLKLDASTASWQQFQLGLQEKLETAREQAGMAVISHFAGFTSNDTLTRKALEQILADTLENMEDSRIQKEAAQLILEMQQVYAASGRQKFQLLKNSFVNLEGNLRDELIYGFQNGDGVRIFHAKGPITREEMDLFKEVYLAAPKEDAGEDPDFQEGEIQAPNRQAEDLKEADLKEPKLQEREAADVHETDEDMESHLPEDNIQESPKPESAIQETVQQDLKADSESLSNLSHTEEKGDLTLQCPIQEAEFHDDPKEEAGPNAAAGTDLEVDAIPGEEAQPVEKEPALPEDTAAAADIKADPDPAPEAEKQTADDRWKDKDMEVLSGSMQPAAGRKKIRLPELCLFDFAEESEAEEKPADPVPLAADAKEEGGSNALFFDPAGHSLQVTDLSRDPKSISLSQTAQDFRSLDEIGQYIFRRLLALHYIVLDHNDALDKSLFAICEKYLKKGYLLKLESAGMNPMYICSHQLDEAIQEKGGNFKPLKRLFGAAEDDRPEEITDKEINTNPALVFFRWAQSRMGKVYGFLSDFDLELDDVWMDETGYICRACLKDGRTVNILCGYAACSQDLEKWKTVLEENRDILRQGKCSLFAGVNREQTAAMAAWIQEVLKTDLNIWYAWPGMDEKLISLHTGECQEMEHIYNRFMPAPDPNLQALQFTAAEDEIIDEALLGDEKLSVVFEPRETSIPRLSITKVKKDKVLANPVQKELLQVLLEMGALPADVLEKVMPDDIAQPLEVLHDMGYVDWMVMEDGRRYAAISQAFKPVYDKFSSPYIKEAQMYCRPLANQIFGKNKEASTVWYAMAAGQAAVYEACHLDCEALRPMRQYMVSEYKGKIHISCSTNTLALRMMEVYNFSSDAKDCREALSFIMEKFHTASGTWMVLVYAHTQKKALATAGWLQEKLPDPKYVLARWYGADHFVDPAGNVCTLEEMAALCVQYNGTVKKKLEDADYPVDNALQTDEAFLRMEYLPAPAKVQTITPRNFKRVVTSNEVNNRVLMALLKQGMVVLAQSRSKEQDACGLELVDEAVACGLVEKVKILGQYPAVVLSRSFKQMLEANRQILDEIMNRCKDWQEREEILCGQHVQAYGPVPAAFQCILSLARDAAMEAAGIDTGNLDKNNGENCWKFWKTEAPENPGLQDLFVAFDFLDPNDLDDLAQRILNQKASQVHKVHAISFDAAHVYALRTWIEELLPGVMVQTFTLQDLLCLIKEPADAPAPVPAQDSMKELPAPKPVQTEKKAEPAAAAPAEKKSRKKAAKVKPVPVQTEKEEAREVPEWQKKTDAWMAEGKYWAAMAWLKAASFKDAALLPAAARLGYALHEPSENRSYDTQTLFTVFDAYETGTMDGTFLSAVLRTVFMNTEDYDLSLHALTEAASSLDLTAKVDGAADLLHGLFAFKKETGQGIDVYASYHFKGESARQKKLENVKKQLDEQYTKVFQGENRGAAKIGRYNETLNILFDKKGMLGSLYEKMRSGPTADDIEEVSACLRDTYMKKGHPVSADGVDQKKIEKVLMNAWDLAGQRILGSHKSSDLMSSLRSNGITTLTRTVSVLAEYTAAFAAAPQRKSTGARLYGDKQEALLELARKGARALEGSQDGQEVVLRRTLQELAAKLDGSYTGGASQYFYVPFLEYPGLELDENFLPVWQLPVNVPELALETRLEACLAQAPVPLEQRMAQIVGDAQHEGSQDFGVLQQILACQKLQGQEESFMDEESLVMEMEAAHDMAREACHEFYASLEMAQCYGKFDETASGTKEKLAADVNALFIHAKHTGNYGMFYTALQILADQIEGMAQTRKATLEKALDALKAQYTQDSQEEILHALDRIQACLNVQKYSAAEDLIHRVQSGDVDRIDIETSDELEKFLASYNDLYQVSRIPQRFKQPGLSAYTKEGRRGREILEAWPSNSTPAPAQLSKLLSLLEFGTYSVEMQERQRNCSWYTVLPNPSLVNTSHPIAAFGSDAARNGFEILVADGNFDDTAIMDLITKNRKEAHTLLLLNWQLKLPERRELARKMKKYGSRWCTAVLDRVSILYMAKNFRDNTMAKMAMRLSLPFAYLQPYNESSSTPMVPEMFIGRQQELDEIKNPSGVNLVYGGRQLGKSALLRKVKDDIAAFQDPNQKAVLIDIKGRSSAATASIVSRRLQEEGILKNPPIEAGWQALGDAISTDIKNSSLKRVLLLLDEADHFIADCAACDYDAFDVLESIQHETGTVFKFVVAGLRDVVRFQRSALDKNSPLPHLRGLTVKPFGSQEARMLLEVPLHYLGFRFPDDEDTEMLVSSVLGQTNYFPGLIQLYCEKLVESLRSSDYGGYSSNDTPPYVVSEKQVRKVLSDADLLNTIKSKFIITLGIGDDHFYHILALLIALLIHKTGQSSVSTAEIMNLAADLDIRSITALSKSSILALLEEMQELNVIQKDPDGTCRFARYNFLTFMGDVEEIENELVNYVSD